jgi:N-methylhydantoinase B
MGGAQAQSHRTSQSQSAQALFIDSGGAGKYRGGLGYVKDICVLRDGFILICCDRTAFGCWGVNGGQAGKPGGIYQPRYGR